ncbi:MAG: DNA recombination protein RmuC [Pseudomonadota bacterium]|nr:DNA recombination protein RmuC [Pseudomonadota bacterium]
METLQMVFIFLTGCFCGAFCFWLSRRIIKKEREKLQEQQSETLTALRGAMEERMKVVAGEALKSNQTSFLELAAATFDRNQKLAKSENEKTELAIKNLLKPVENTLKEYKKNLTEIEKERQKAYGNVTAELQNVVKTQVEVRSQTGKLVNALRANPKTRGRWGEETLKNVMELSGMIQYCDFNIEKSFETKEGKLRPDVIINLPGERQLVVDAKTSTSAYMDALESDEEEEREHHLTIHAQQIRRHMKQLSAKAYWDGLAVTPDFVVMFIPGDNFFSAAIERDPGLFEDAIKEQVLIVTPTTLIALAKAVAYGWRQEKVAENYRQIGELGADLYKRITTMGSHVENLGKSLANAVSKFNEFIGSLESSVLPQARKFRDLEIEGANKEVRPLDPIEHDIREPRRDKDLKFISGIQSEEE